MKKESYKIVKRPLITEKGTSLNAAGQYPFEVAMEATKAEIKQAVEEIFSVHVQKVRTMTRVGKPRRYRYWKGTTSEWKRAIVTLAPGETIEFI
jgi:large subunit ribosomal protein L23